MPSITPRMVGLYLFLFWVQCITGIGINAYNLALQSADSGIADIILQAIVESEKVGIGAATNSLIVVITVEGILVLASYFKKKWQEEVDIAKGFKQGVAAERKRTNAKLRAWAEERGIPIENCPLMTRVRDSKDN